MHNFPFSWRGGLRPGSAQGSRDMWVDQWVSGSLVLPMHGRILIFPGQGSWPSKHVPLLSHPSHLQNGGGLRGWGNSWSWNAGSGFPTCLLCDRGQIPSLLWVHYFIDKTGSWSNQWLRLWGFVERYGHDACGFWQLQGFLKSWGGARRGFN